MKRRSEAQAAPLTPGAVRLKAMDLLARREHSRLELQRKLCRKGCDEALVEAVLAQLVAEGLLSDGRFAESYVNARKARGEGPVRIRAALREKGVGDELIADVLDDEAADWQALIRAAWHKRFAGKLPQDHKERARQARFLQQRGFTMEQIGALLFRGDIDE